MEKERRETGERGERRVRAREREGERKGENKQLLESNRC